MQTRRFLVIVTTTMALGACGGEEPAPVAPAPPPPPPATASASAPPAPPPAPAPPPKPSLAELVPQALRGINDAFNAHDAKKLASFYTEDTAVIDYGPGQPGHGRDDVTKAVQMVFDTFGDAKMAILRTWQAGNVGIVESAWTGTMTGDMMGIKATKKPVGQLRLHIVMFNDDGLVKEEHQYADSAGLMAQMTGKKGAPAVPALPTNAPEGHVAKGTPDEAKLVDWAKAMDDTFNKDDAKAVLAGAADDADYWVNFKGAPASKGKKDLTKDATAWFKAFPDQKWATANAWGIDGFAIVEHTMTGTQKGAVGPLAATGKAVTWHFVDML